MYRWFLSLSFRAQPTSSPKNQNHKFLAKLGNIRPTKINIFIFQEMWIWGNTTYFAIDSGGENNLTVIYSQFKPKVIKSDMYKTHVP
jgi:hypothetical protein